MMHPTCLNSSVSLRCRASRSLYFDDPNYFSDARFESNRLLISSSFGCSSCCCCCCSANSSSIYNSLPRINPSFLCNGLRQSTLIQFSPSKRLIVHGRRRQLCDNNITSRVSSRSDCGLDRRYYYKKLYSFNERRKLGEGRYACWSYEDDKNGPSFSDEVDDDCVDEVELLLDLLTEGVELENVGVRDKKRIQKKDSSNISGRTKTVSSGSVKRDLKCDTKAAEVRSSEKENRKLSNDRKKQGSSCSSYYSVSSTGDYDNDSDNDVEIEHGDYVVKGDSSSEYKDDRKMDSHSRVYDEVVENVEKQQEFGRKQSEVLKKNTVESYYGNQEWRKKSEKKLNVESSQSQHTERNSQQQNARTDRITRQLQSGMKNKNSSTQKVYSDTENKFVTSVQELTSHHKGETSDFTRQNEYKKQSNVISEASEIHNFDKRMASSSSSSFETRLKNSEENLTEVREQFEDQREEKHQRVDQLTSSKQSRVKSQRISEITNIENTSVQHTQSDIRTKKQETHLESSSSLEKRENIEGKYSSSQVAMVMGPTESTKTGKKTTKASSFHVGMLKEPSSSYKALKLNPESSFQETGVHITSADEQQKSAGRFVEKAKHQLSISEGELVSEDDEQHEPKSSGRKTSKASSFHVGMPKEASSSYKALKLNPESKFQETGGHITSADEQQKSAGQIVGEFVEKAKHQLSISEGESAREDDEQHELKSSGENGSGSYDENDGAVGPSDEMWHESGAPVNTSSDEQVKRSGRSLWNVIGDVVRLRWGSSRSETHTPKSGGVSNQSTSSERWFSGREPDESSRKDVSTPSSFKDKQDSPLLLSSSNNNQGSSSKSMSPLVIEESSIPLPAIRMRRSPVVKTTSVTGEADLSTSGKVDQTVPKPLTQVPDMDVSGSGKVGIVEQPIPSRRKLGRIDQVSKDRFDDWEEAYNIEAKQRKFDEFFMREALSEAKKAADLWEVPVGAVLVQDGKIISRGYNLVEELRDSTAHAEMVCIREASNKLHSWRLSGTTLYVTLEPCPMCAGAILQARIDTVVWGAPNKLLGADGSWIRLFPDGDGGNGSDKPPAPVHPFHPNMKVRRGVLASDCADVMQQFFQLRRKKKDKKPEAESPSPPPPSCLPIAHHHNSKFVTKLHDVFNIMFCL